MNYKLGETVYILNGISGEIMLTTYGGQSWQEELGLIDRDEKKLQQWIRAIKNENRMRYIEDEAAELTKSQNNKQYRHKAGVKGGE